MSVPVVNVRRHPTPAEQQIAEARADHPRITFVLSYPPSINAQYATVSTIYGRTRRVLSKEAKAWKQATKDQVMGEAYQAAFRVPKGARLAFSIVVCRPAGVRGGDVDGRTKITQDAVCAGLGVDDARVERVTAEKGEPVAGGAAVVTVEVLHATP